MRTSWILVPLLGLLLALTSCTNQEARPSQSEAPSGFEFVVNPGMSKVQMVPHPGGWFVPTAEGPRVLVPNEELALSFFEFEFLDGNILEIRALFQNVTADHYVGRYFLTPFFFTENPMTSNIVSSTLPGPLHPVELGNGSLSPGEVTRENCEGCTFPFTFRVTHKGEPFSFFVDANAVVGDFNDAIGAGAPLLQNGKQIFMGSRAAPDLEDNDWCGFTLVRYLPNAYFDPSFGTDGITSTQLNCDPDSFGGSAGLQPDGHIIAVGGGRVAGLISGGFVVRYDPDGEELAQHLISFADRTSVFGFEILPDSNVIITGSASGAVQFDAFNWYLKPDLSSIMLFVDHASLTQPNGKMLFAGRDVFPRDAALVRHNPDRSLDTGFGDNGFVTIDVGGRDRILALQLQPDDSILATGSSSACPSREFSVVVHPDGSYDPPVCSSGILDSSFGTGGRVTTDYDGSPNQVQALAVQADGKIIAAGRNGPYFSAAFALARYHPDGSLDGSFGSGGLVTTNVSPGNDNVYALALQGDGKIVAAGCSPCYPAGNRGWAVARYDTDGSLDPTFGSNGVALTDFLGDRRNEASAVDLLPDGRLVVGGMVESGTPTGRDFAVARYH